RRGTAHQPAPPGASATAFELHAGMIALFADLLSDQLPRGDSSRGGGLSTHAPPACARLRGRGPVKVSPVGTRWADVIARFLRKRLAASRARGIRSAARAANARSARLRAASR